MHPRMTQFRRGIAPELLVTQVKNTLPYLFDRNYAETPLDRLTPTVIIKEYVKSTDSLPKGETSLLNHFEYFRLCLSAHYLTCGSLVPTDVDNQIRHKLWPAELPLKTALQMAQIVLESHDWNFTLLSPRFVDGVFGGISGEVSGGVSGHMGEWFTLSCAAYCALKRYRDSLAQEKRQQLFERIAAEIHRHSEVFGSLWRANDGIGCLKAAACIAHNFGDLDRVMDIWELSVDDPLRLEFYNLTVLPFDSNRKLRYLGRLWVAGELYKSTIDGSSMALENHRHFALRKPRCLRRSTEFLVPMGPFFDDWGRRVARGLATADGAPTEETFEVERKF